MIWFCVDGTRFGLAPYKIGESAAFILEGFEYFGYFCNGKYLGETRIYSKTYEEACLKATRIQPYADILYDLIY